ncbi:MAG: hypothetical protein EOP49_51070 [Sphingobacteriales bacterium]|nr:MAG: hypothetical protein EOP49_51070 [Sphingobacteriales bacterium]
MKTMIYSLLFLLPACPAMAADPPGCFDAHTGIFEVAAHRELVTVKRTDIEQIDYIGEQFMRYILKWTDDCTCTLRLVETDIESAKPLVGATFIMVITSVKGDRFRISTTHPDETVTEAVMRKYKNAAKAK